MRTLHDIGVIFRGELTLAMRNRTGIAIGLVQPFVYLLLFGPLLTQAGACPRRALWLEDVAGSR